MDAARRLGRFVRARSRLRPVNECDPITLEELGRCCFRLVSPDGVVTGYDAGALRAYFESTHMQVDPISRRPLCAPEVRRLVRATGGGALLIDTRRRHDELERTMLNAALERDVGDVVERALVCVEQLRDVEMDWVHWSSELACVVGQLAAVDGAATRRALCHCIERTLSTIALVHDVADACPGGHIVLDVLGDYLDVTGRQPYASPEIFT